MKSRKGYSREGGGSGYAYTNTRVRVKKAMLLKPDDFKKFMKMSLHEIASYLGQGTYKKEVEELGVRFKGMNLIEYALNKNLERTFQKILGFSLERAGVQIKLYLKRYDIYNIKTVLRGKHSKASVDKILNELIACGELTRVFLEDVVRKAANVSEVMEFFKGTEYYDMLKKDAGDMHKLEDELDKFYYSQVLKKAEKELKEYIGYEIWVKNTLNKLRGQKHKLQENVIKMEMLPGDKPVKLKVPLKEENVDTRIFLKKLLVTKGLKMVYEFKTNVRPVLGYFIAKENEINNIRIIARGKHSGLPEDLVSKQLVM